MQNKVISIILILITYPILAQNTESSFNSARFEKKVNSLSIRPSLNTIENEIEEEVELELALEELRNTQMIDSLRNDFYLLEKSIKTESKKEDRSSKYSLPFDDEIFITSNFGVRIHPITGQKKIHKGIDIRARYEEVKSMISGRVISTGFEKGYGYYIKIKQHKGDYEILYAHLKNYFIKVGETVTAGEIIGTTGNTGASTAPHLHIETRYRGELFNPLYFINNIKIIGNGRFN